MSFFIDHRPRLKLYLQGVIENFKYLNTLPAIPMEECKKCIQEMREIRAEIKALNREWVDYLTRKLKK